MPFKDPDTRRAYQAAWLRKRRQDWIDENGPCAWCSSDEELQVDHRDRSLKEHYMREIWSLALTNPKRIKELAKCQVLCEACHGAKTASEVVGTIHENCRRGHPLDAGNIYQHPKSGRQECLRCKHQRKKEENERNRRLRLQW
jgi:hypothetical protein